MTSWQDEIAQLIEHNNVIAGLINLHSQRLWNCLATGNRPDPEDCPNQTHDHGMAYNTELDRAQCPICLYTIEEEMGG